ncbi:MAG: hypothetical protein KJO55_06650, partial [Gammaproteobacteria bacterium]|nr:hypothetical protein [Gammaproteobacteria bacterium]
MTQCIGALALASAVSACNPGAEPARPASWERLISGQVAKGPLAGALVEVYAIDDRGQSAGPQLAQTTTDASGQWSVAVFAPDQPLLVRASGGRYVDEADPQPDPAGRRSVTLGPDDSFAALLPAAASSVAINAYTDALLRKSQHETQGSNFLAVYENNRVYFERAFGFDISAILPTDPIQPDPQAGLPQRQYAMALGGIANVVNALATANQLAIADFTIIDAVIDDLTDCRIDGRSNAGPLTGLVTLSEDLNFQILRFRNNNFAVYQDTTLLQLDLAECARSGRLPDTVAPVFTVVPDDFTVAAVDAQGTASSTAAVQAVLATVRALDDRDGSVMPQVSLPAMLPLGDTLVTLTASDLAGNVVQATLVITVADLDAPNISAPPDRDVIATGALTEVDLGEPQVGDNVTPVAGLLVANDAPTGGFAPGIHVVTWRVTDSVGLVAEAVQRVTVRTAAPTVDTPLPDLQASEGDSISLAVTAGFTDTDSSLSFSVTGLPAGSGLAFD